jgi:hypothetical protein
MARKPKSSGNPRTLFRGVSYTALRRATPDENRRMGFSPKARHYVRADIKRVTAKTPSISARAYETKKSRDLYGVTPEQATEQRRTGEIRYTSRTQQERVEKAQDSNLLRKSEKLIGERIENFNPKRRKQGFVFNEKVRERYKDNRQRYLNGEWLETWEYAEMRDVARQLGDARITAMRYPKGLGAGFSVES